MMVTRMGVFILCIILIIAIAGYVMDWRQKSFAGKYEGHTNPEVSLQNNGQGKAGKGVPGLIACIAVLAISVLLGMILNGPKIRGKCLENGMIEISIYNDMDVGKIYFAIGEEKDPAKGEGVLYIEPFVVDRHDVVTARVEVLSFIWSSRSWYEVDRELNLSDEPGQSISSLIPELSPTPTPTPSSTPTPNPTPSQTPTPEPPPSVSTTADLPFWMEESAVEFYAGETMDLTIHWNEEERDLWWKSENEGIVSVDQSGRLYGNSPGSCYVHAIIDEIAWRCMVTVLLQEQESEWAEPTQPDIWYDRFPNEAGRWESIYVEYSIYESNGEDIYLGLQIGSDGVERRYVLEQPTGVLCIDLSEFDIERDTAYSVKVSFYADGSPHAFFAEIFTLYII